MNRRWSILAGAVAVGLLGASAAYAGASEQPTLAAAPKAATAAWPAAGKSTPFDGPRWSSQPAGRRGIGGPAATWAGQRTGQRGSAAPADPIGETKWTIMISAVDRAGRSVAEPVNYSIHDLKTGNQVAYGYTGIGDPVRLPAGRYSAHGYVEGTDAGTGASSRTLVILPEVAVTGDTSITLDARAGRPVSATLDQPQARQVSAAIFVYQRAENGQQFWYANAARDFSEGVYVTPTERRDDLTSYVYTVWTRPDASDVYNLVSRTAGKVPQRLSYHWRTAELAATQVRYSAQGVAACGGTYIGPYLAGERAPLAYGTRLALPSLRMEYYSPHVADVQWLKDFGQTSPDCSFDENDVQTSPPYGYAQPGRYSAAWNTAPLSPTPAWDGQGWPAAARWGNIVSIGLSAYSDSQRRHNDQGGPYAGTTGKIDLYQGEKLIASSDTLERLFCNVPAWVDDYRVVLTAERKVAWSTLATRTEASWNFRSGPLGETSQPMPLPLLDVRYRVASDDYNQVPANRLVKLSVQITNPAQAKGVWAGAVGLSVSFDDGVGWQPLRLWRDGGQWHTWVPAHSAGSVSLRLTASDEAGNDVTQTLIRAYAIR